MTTEPHELAALDACTLIWPNRTAAQAAKANRRWLRKRMALVLSRLEEGKKRIGPVWPGNRITEAGAEPKRKRNAFYAEIKGRQQLNREHREKLKARVCTVEGCEGHQHSKGLCVAHYKLAKKASVGTARCRVPNCIRWGTYAHGMCNRHYQAWRRGSLEVEGLLRGEVA
jgi:hypothetical protein